MSKQLVIYETPSRWDYLFIKKHLLFGTSVWVIEPFRAYHHKKWLPFFPPPFPDFIEDMITSGKIKMLTADKLNAREIFHIASKKAVDSVEAVFPYYKKKHKEILRFTSNTLNTDISESVFKKNICEKLAEFYSVNIIINKIEDIFCATPVFFSPDTNVLSYMNLKELIEDSHEDFHEHSIIKFSTLSYLRGYFEKLRENCISILRLVAQTLVSGILGKTRSHNKNEKKNYLYGMAMIAPLRQLRGNQRGPDFIIDNNKIKADDVVYLPIVDLTNEQKKKLECIQGNAFYPPKVGRFFSNFTEWRKLLLLAVKRIRSLDSDTGLNEFRNQL
jgi:hypothetical protein